jgi:spore maturation protein CgeB
MNSVNARLFEATAAGGAVLCEERDVLKDLFRLNDEVLAFSTFNELVAHCYALLEEPALSQAVGNAATKRAHAEHTYEVRLTAILDHLS